jgi:hypothetical protein
MMIFFKNFQSVTRLLDDFKFYDAREDQ